MFLSLLINVAAQVVPALPWWAAEQCSGATLLAKLSRCSDNFLCSWGSRIVLFVPTPLLSWYSKQTELNFLAQSPPNIPRSPHPHGCCVRKSITITPYDSLSGSSLPLPVAESVQNLTQEREKNACLSSRMQTTTQFPNFLILHPNKIWQWARIKLFTP